MIRRIVLGVLLTAALVLSVLSGVAHGVAAEQSRGQTSASQSLANVPSLALATR